MRLMLSMLTVPIFALVVVCLVLALLMYAPIVNAGEQSNEVCIWSLDTSDELATFGDDGTGTRFATEHTLVTQGKGAATIIPSGTAIETKVAIPLEGETLARWLGRNGDLTLSLYIPPTNKSYPSMFFLGLADITDSWSWVGGVFSSDKAQPGWNRIRYPLSAIMSDLDATHRYKVFLAFGAYASGDKVPLTESFIIDGIFKDHDPDKQKITKVANPSYTKEVEKLLKSGDSKLLDTVTKRAFEYFWYEANPANGLVKDRSTKDSLCSVAAVGFGLSAIPIAVERGWITREQGLKRTLTTLKTFASGGVDGHKGFFYHFVDMTSGKRHADSELSSIDTALFIAGALTAGQYFSDTEAAPMARQLYEAVDWDWMTDKSTSSQTDGPTLCMGWWPRTGFTKARWERFDESMVMYLLAIGSPTHSIPSASWDSISRPIVGRGDSQHIALLDEPLFIYQYSHAWVDFRGKEDRYANYWNNSIAATKYNREFCMEKSSRYTAFTSNIWGLSASDGPSGYRAYGASEGNVDGTIAPYAAVASMPFTPELSMMALRAMLETYGGLVWGKYGLVSAFNERYGWYSDQHIGIDMGDIMLMVENYRSGLVWKLFMGVPEIQKAMAAVGFHPSSSNYAVAPGYYASR